MTRNIESSGCCSRNNLMLSITVFPPGISCAPANFMDIGRNRAQNRNMFMQNKNET
jgi:hypothetical protein